MPKSEVLTVASVKNKKPTKARKEYADAAMPGLYLVVQPTGAKSWAFRYRFLGKPQKLTIEPGLGLKGTRDKARGYHEMLADGKDPKRVAEAERQNQKRAQADIYSAAVEDFVKEYHKAKKKNRSWKESRRLLLKHGFGKRPLTEVTERDIKDVLKGLMAEGKPYLANRVYAAMATFFLWSRKDKRIAVNPIEDIDKPFDAESARVRHFDDAEIKALWQAADKLPQHAGAFLKVLLLTGKRKGALAAMRWTEIDNDGIWKPPVDPRRRAGNKRTHAGPLSKLALRVLAGLPRVDDNPYVFVGRRIGGHMDPGTPLQTTIKELSGVADFFYHATRHTAETRLADLKVLPHIRDLLLDHASQRGSGKGYDHHLYYPEMRAALEAWAAKVESLVAPKGVSVLR